MQMIGKLQKLIGVETLRGAAYRLRRLAWFALLVISAWPAVVSAQGQASTPKGVLVLYYYGKDYPANVEFEEGVLSALKTTQPGAFEYYPEYLEPNRFPGKVQSEAFQDYLRKKYADHRIDVIIAQTDIALSFLMQYRKDLFPSTPIVFFARKRPELSGQPGEPGYSGVVADHAYQQTLELALTVHPGTKRVYVVTGTPENDPTLPTIVQDQLRPFESRLEVTYLTNLPLGEMLAQVKNASTGSIILYVRYSQDEPGKTLGPREILALVAQSSKVPIYGIAEGFVGHGIVGGYVFRQQEAGKRLGEMALSIATGTRAADLPIETARMVPMFDWRELRRWRIDDNRLPADSVIRFREPTFWEQYKWRIVGVISLVTLQALLIVFLLVQRSRRRQAERDTERFARLLEAQHRRLDEVVSNVPGVVWETSIDPVSGESKTEFVSRYIEKMLGYEEDSFRSRQGFGLSLVPAEDRQRVKDESQAILASKQPGSIQFCWTTKDGRALWVEAHLTVVTDESGEPVGMRGVTMDITGRREAEESLRASEQRLRMGLQAGKMIAWDWDPALDQLNTVGDISEIYGTDTVRDAAQGFSLLHPEDLQAHQSIVNAAVLQGGSYQSEFRVIRPDNGATVWIEERGEAVINGDGKAKKVTGVVMDITERRRAEEAVRESEARFRHMADSAAVLIWMADTGQLCTFFNRRVLEFTGRSMEELLGEGWLNLVHEDDRARCIDAYKSGYESLQPFIMEFRILRADGEFRWIYDIGSPRFSSDGGFLGYIGSAVDITDRKIAEEALQIAHAEVSKLKNQLEAENVYLQEEIKLAHNVNEIIGESDAINYVLFKIEQVSQTDTTVLILGETGTGKELVARAIHNQSSRKDRPLVKVNCAALSASLIESELFGHEKGAFTGASARKIGRFELADGATIFLDEIGELPLELQPKLLRVVQEGEFERLGGTKTLKVDVRILAATNRNLKDEVDKGTFREDLWYRLNVFPLSVPPLRQRRDDIPLMVDHFVQGFSRKVGKSITSISANTLTKLKDYSWPGNVRELANVIERAVISAKGQVLHIGDQFEEPKREKDSALNRTLEEIEKDYILRVLESTGWRIEGSSGAALILGMNPSTLRTRMVKLGIQKGIQTSVGTSGSRR